MLNKWNKYKKLWKPYIDKVFLISNTYNWVVIKVNGSLILITRLTSAYNYLTNFVKLSNPPNLKYDYKIKVLTFKKVLKKFKQLNKLD